MGFRVFFCAFFYFLDCFIYRKKTPEILADFRGSQLFVEF